MTALILPASIARGAQSVMAAKRPKQKLSAGTPWEELELFPTPPWATRALFRHVLPVLGVSAIASGWDPCAGLGHMSEVLKEFVPDVRASDIHTYALACGGDTALLGVEQHDFLSDATRPDARWIVTNPPFSQSRGVTRGAAMMMARKALAIAPGVALLLRLQFLETEQRYELFTDFPPSIVAAFSERVPMCEGGWDPAGDTATAYAWFVWVRNPYDGTLDGPARNFAKQGVAGFEMMLIPPVCATTLSRDSDRRLAARYVPGWVPPSTIKRSGRQQQDMFS